VWGNISTFSGFQSAGATGTASGGLRMQVPALFVLVTVILDACAVGICMIVERYSEYGSLIAFLGLFVVNFIIAWQIAVRLTERYFLSDVQRVANEEHTRRWNAHLARARR
jgi:uncharacterized membrane protein